MPLVVQMDGNGNEKYNEVMLFLQFGVWTLFMMFKSLTVMMSLLDQSTIQSNEYERCNGLDLLVVFPWVVAS